jgi:hypothetical protein
MRRTTAKYGIAFIIRWSSFDAMTVFPPEISRDGQWHEMRGSIQSRTPAESEVLSLAMTARHPGRAPAPSQVTDS